MLLEDEKVDGFVYYPYKDESKIPARLYKNKNKTKLELIGIDDNFGFGNQEINGVFEINHRLTYVTFLNCYKPNLKRKPEVEFDGYIAYHDFGPDKEERFINLQSKRETISFTLPNLKNWLWPDSDILEDYKCEFLNQNKMKVQKEDAEYLLLKMLQQNNEFHVKHKEVDITIALISEFERYGYPKIICEPYSYIQISVKEEQEVMFFIEIIKKLEDLFSLFFNEKTIIENIYEFESCKYRIDYFFNLYTDNKTEESFLYGKNIAFKDIKDDFTSILQNWFDKYEDYRFVIRSICEYYRPRYLNDIFCQQVQFIETFGNTKNKGGKTREDILASLAFLDDDLFKKIFFLTQESDVKYQFDEKCFFDISKTYKNTDEYKKEIANQIMNIRNHFIHPYKNGSLKTPQDDFILPIFEQGKNHLDYKKIGKLAKRLKILSEILLLKEINAHGYYQNITPY